MACAPTESLNASKLTSEVKRHVRRKRRKSEEDPRQSGDDYCQSKGDQGQSGYDQEESSDDSEEPVDAEHDCREPEEDPVEAGITLAALRLGIWGRGVNVGIVATALPPWCFCQECDSRGVTPAKSARV